MSKTFIVTAGHSNTDPGACAHGRREADIAVDMRKMVKLYLERDGHKVLTDGVGDDNKSLNDAIKLIDKNCINVEFHCNAATPSAKGVETLAKTKDANLAKAISKAISEIMEIPLRRDEGWYSDANEHHRFGFVRNGGLIVELFFITNKDELAKWDAKKWLVAKEVARVISEF